MSYLNMEILQSLISIRSSSWSWTRCEATLCTPQTRDSSSLKGKWIQSFRYQYIITTCGPSVFATLIWHAWREHTIWRDPSARQFTDHHSLIRSGAALPFTAHATSPTITMPRVKAITTGSIPSFLDVILNFAESDTSSSLANQDTWLAQIKNKNNGKLVMYGDDTWLKLFPDTFLRADGTSSFFVSVSDTDVRVDSAIVLNRSNRILLKLTTMLRATCLMNCEQMIGMP